MSKSIDEKIVKVSMQNEGFMSKIRETLSGLNMFTKKMTDKHGINLGNSVGELKNLQNEANHFTLDGIGRGVESIRSKFSLLSVAAISAFSTIVSKATSAGIQMAKSLSVKPMIDGFDMYSNKMKTIQVIQANTGAGVKNINGVLGDLNDYANKTVYSFQDMTTNLGTFTAAGVGLKTAKTDMIGLSNLAAASGSNTQQAGMAMYQLSQAVAAGKVGLQDWNSVVNAGMGGKKFQQALMKNGVEMGKNVKMTDNFRNSLQKGWLTSDVLNKTLAQFAKDKSMLKAATQAKTFSDVMDSAEDELKSGWATTWELLLGNYSQAPKLFTAIQQSISNMITKSAASRNDLLKSFDDLGGRAKLIDTLRTAFEAVAKVVNTVKEAFHDVFPPATGASLMKIVTALDEFVHKLILSKSNTENLRNTMDGFFSIIKIGGIVLGAIGRVLAALIPDNLLSLILSITGTFGKMITNFANGLKVFDGTGSSLKNLSKASNDFGEALQESGTKIGKFFGIVANFANQITSKIAPAIKSFFSGFTSTVGKMDWNSVLTTGLTASGVILIRKIKAITDPVKGIIDDFVKGVKHLGGITDLLDSLKDSLVTFQQSVKAKALLNTALAISALALSVGLLSSIPASKISKSLFTIAVSLGIVTKFMSIAGGLKFNKLEMMATVASIIGIAGALVELSVAIGILSLINPTRLATGLAAIAASLTILVFALKAMSTIKGSTIGAAIALNLMAVALTQLSIAIGVMGSLPIGTLTRGLIGFAGALGIVAAYSALTKKNSISIGSAIALGVTASSLTVLAFAVGKLASIPWQQLIIGEVALAAILASIVAFSHAVNVAKLDGADIAIAILTTALLGMVGAIKQLSALSYDKMIKGLVGLAASLGIAIAALKLLPNNPAGATALLLTASAVIVFTAAIKSMASLGWGGLAIGLTGFAVGLAAIIAAGFAAEAVLPGLTALAGVLLSYSVAALATAASLVGVAAALTAITAITATMAGSIIAALTVMVKGFTNMMPQLVTLGKAAIQGFITVISSSIPQLVGAGIKMILALMQGVASNIGRFVVLGAEILINFMNGLASVAEPLAMAGANLIIKLVNAMANAIRAKSPQIVSAVLNVIESIMEVVITALQQVLTIMLGWIPGFSGLASKAGSSAKSALRSAFNVKEVGSKGGQDFADGVNSKSGSAKNAGKNLGDNAKSGSKTDLSGNGHSAGQGFANSLGSHSGGAKGAGKALSLGALGGSITNLTGNGSNAGQGFVDGVNGKSGSSRNAGHNVANNAKSGANADLYGNGSSAGQGFVNGVNGKKGNSHAAGKNVGDSAKSGSNVDLYGSGAHAGQGFADGVNSKRQTVKNAVTSIGQFAVGALRTLLSIHSPSRVMAELGMWTGVGFANGIADQSDKVTNSSSVLANAAIDATTKAMSAVSDAVNDNLDLQPKITPVVDTSNIKSASLPNTSIVTSGLVTNMNAKTIKMDTSSLENKIDKLIDALNSSDEDGQVNNYYMNNYGKLDDKTALSWANKLDWALGKYSNRRGGVAQ